MLEIERVEGIIFAIKRKYRFKEPAWLIVDFLYCYIQDKTMKNSIIMLAAFLLIVLANGAPNLHIGTGGFGYGCGSNSPAAQVPYSFVRLGPDTSPIVKK